MAGSDKWSEGLMDMWMGKTCLTHSAAQAMSLWFCPADRDFRRDCVAERWPVILQKCIKTLIRQEGAWYIFFINISRELHCAWLVPHTRASSEQHAWGYFLARWVRKGSPTRIAQGGLVDALVTIWLVEPWWAIGVGIIEVFHL
ncbi:hypothetical protein M9H77_18035 [Catharanthus roseus]|uniref:Uncharacterized protein n=1 Tax=Catharanthus roseus TaxID=4058 RepID=A0ACC0B6I3_CATRO|nr:hypothetical protein M9H77_18035 [Catharanthus roseus]